MSGASQEAESQQIESVIDSIRDYLQEINPSLTGGISNFINGYWRGCPDYVRHDLSEIMTAQYRDSGKMSADVFAKRARSQTRRRCEVNAAINNTSNGGC